MNKEIIRLTESDLYNIIKESVTRVINEMMESPYWKCEFVDTNGRRVWKMIYAESTPRAQMNALGIGYKIGMKPKLETLRNATKEEIAAFDKMIRRRIKKNNVS